MNWLPTLQLSKVSELRWSVAALLVGGALSLQLGSPVIVLVLLVAGKTLLDYGMHLAEHEAASEHQSSLATTT